MNGPDVGKTAVSKQQFKGSTSSAPSSSATLDSVRKQAASPFDAQTRKATTPQPKAWQGPNPITQRSSAARSAAVPNGTEKSHTLSRPASGQQPAKHGAETHFDKSAHDRALFLLAACIGYDATLTMKNGEQFSGIFSGTSTTPPAKLQYIMKMVRRTRSPGHGQANGVSELQSEYIGEGEDHTMSFDRDDTFDLAVSQVKITGNHAAQNGSIGCSFRTDTEISARDSSIPRERELQRWVAAPSDPAVEMSLGDSSAGGWDQFATNERLYGVQSTYDENLYTTTIDRSNPAYRQREAEAARIAREIEGSTSASGHVTEERQRDGLGDDGVDEEDKYSGVKRETTALPKRAAGAYVPPSQRPITNAPTVPGAPYDPAIISSQLASPAPSATPVTPNEEPKPPKAIDTAEAQNNSTSDANGKDKRAAMLSSAPKKPRDSTTEDYMRDLTDSFKQFANNEKLRIRQAQEAKRSSQKAEKMVKFNDLKKFSENFKLTSRVPDDLVPILAKDREKQVQIQTKAELAAKEEEIRAKEKEKEKDKAPVSSPPAARVPENGNVPPVPHQRGPGYVNHRSQGSQNTVGAPAMVNQGSHNRRNGAFQHPYRHHIEPLPANLRDLHRQPAAVQHEGLRSPSVTPKLNVNAKAFEFKPSAAAFTPTGTSPSPRRLSATERPNSVDPAVHFFSGKKALDPAKPRDLEDKFNVMKGLREGEYTEEYRKIFASNKGIPRPYQTPPTWPVPDSKMEKSYKDQVPGPQATAPGISPMHTPGPGHLMHSHQIPHHFQQQIPGPPQRGSFIAAPHHLHGPPAFDPSRAQQFGPNGSVQNSPRVPPMQMAFNNHMAGMPQFAASQMPFTGMSPSMQYRQIPPNAMMMGPAQGQIPLVPQGFPRGPAGFDPRMMGGAPMVNQHSSSFSGGPVAQQGGYSPLPPQVQPHMPHTMGPQQQMAYGGSPRPGAHMMQHSSSYQGGLPPHGSPMPHHMQPGAPGQPPNFAMPSPGQYFAGPPPPQQRYPQMTPRSQAAVPQRAQGSPSMAVAGQTQGDEGK